MSLVSLTKLITAAQAGQIVSFPTDTVPGLAVLPECAHQLYQAKGRAPAKPLILLAAQSADLWPYVSGSPAEQARWQQMAEAHWPGALTLVLPASGKHPQAMTPLDHSSLGIRVPKHGVAQRILAITGPLATTSANRSGEPALTSLAAIAQAFPDVATLDLATEFGP
ncbi:MAG: L-threonylcarbamoyladenylate synthase, partial [Synechococcales cyanobacterium RU_4_20]|nr:L-threonylcarbamoyladenylate synthase [Synechococcales cyanobacterium RU_4_20]